MAKVQTETKDQKDQEIDPRDPFKTHKNRKITAEEFWKLIGSIEPGLWGRYKAYLYSLWPIIVRQLSNPNNKNNLAVIEEPFDSDYLLRKFGSGTYQIVLVDQSRPHHVNTVCKTEIKLKDDDYPPVRDLRELDMGHQENRSYIEGLRARGLLKGDEGVDGKTSDNAALIGLVREMLGNMKQQHPAQSVEGQAIGKALDLLSSTYSKGTEMLVGTLKQDSGAGGLAIVKEVLGVVEKLKPATANGDNRLVELLMKMQADSQAREAALQARQTELILEVVKAKTAPPDPDAGLFANLDKLARVKEFFGGGDEGGGGGGRWWNAVIQSPAMPELLSTLRTAADGFYAWATRGAASNPALTPPPATRTAATSTTHPQPTPLSPQVQMLVEMARLMRNAIDLGMAGDEFAEKFEHRWGAATYEQVISVPFGEALPTLQRIAPVWEILGPVATTLPEFLAGFYAYAEPDPGDVPPASEPPTKTRKPRGGGHEG